MKIMLMDAEKLVNLQLPKDIFGNYWIINDKKENLVNVEAVDGNWVLKSNSEVKVFRNGSAVEETLLELEKFYTLRNVTSSESYVIYTCPIYDKNAFQLDMSIGIQENSIASWYIGNNGAQSNSAPLPNIISYEQPGIARNQLKLTFNKGEFSIYNINGQIPLYVNGKKCDSAILKHGDRIFILGLKISIIKNIFYINNPNRLIKYDSQMFQLRMLPTLDFSKIPEEPDPTNEMYKKDDYFLKPPRFDERIEEKTMEIDPPPEAQKQEEMPAILTMGSMLMMGMSSIMTGLMTLSGVINGTTDFSTAAPSILSAVAMLATMLILPTVTKMYNNHKKKVYERKRQATYSVYVSKKREEFLTEMKREQQILIDKYIPLKDVGDIILYKKRNLWEKNPDDYDFLSLRLGIGAIPPFFKINYPDEHFSMEDEDNLMEYLRVLEKETEELNNVPVTYSFVEKYITAIIGPKEVTDSFLRGLLLQIFAYHGYDSLKIVVFTNNRNAEFWEDIKNCPYFWDDNRTLRFFGTNNDEIGQISAYFEEMLNSIKEANESKTGSSRDEGVKLTTRYLIITDDIDLVRNVSIIRSLVESTEYIGISLMILTERLNSLPNEVEHFISVDEKTGGIFERVLSDSKRINFVPDFMYASLEKYTYVLSNIPIALNGGKFQLPATYSFLEMYNVSNVNQLNALSRWKESDPINSLAAPVGINEYGEPFKLDLHEKQHGPHGLIAGMTGSGKSEFIITFILSTAVNYHPYEVQFVLIDYKGGGLAGAFENRETGLKLPHLAGTITNLDVSEINRSLASLQSELKRRQAAFNVARDKVGESTIDIYKYQRMYRNGQVDEPIAHLFIISDEFAELKAQQPEFMDELISTSRIGRSLGVHLILATQKPSGVVNDQIWSNSKFKVCLKVQDRSDSQEMIKRPDAASIKETGRFFLQVGYDEYFAMGQSAWTGAPYYESDVRKKKVDNDITFVDNLGMPVKIVDDGKSNVAGVLKGEELPNIMKYLVDLSKKENIKVKQLWLSALPPVIYIDGLKEKYSFQKVDCDINPVIGEYDAPDLQKQGLLTLPVTQTGNWIFYGMADSGKEEAINSFVYSCITTYSPLELNLYLLDFGAETLKVYRKAPQVGDVILQNDQDKVINLWRMLSEKIEGRKKLFADYGGDYVSYSKATGKVLPNIITIINGFESYNENYGDATFDLLTTLTRDCQKYGVYVIMTSTTSNGIRSRLAQYLPNHLVFQMNDKYDYSSLLARTKVVPSNIEGRGLCKLDAIYEFQAAVPTEKDNLNTFLLEKIKKLQEQYPQGAPKVPVLPEVVTIAECSDELKGLNSVPVGIEKDSLKVRTIDLTKDTVNIVTSLESDTMKPFGNMFIKELANLIGKNCYVFDLEKQYSTYSELVNYCDTDIQSKFKEFGQIVFNMFNKYKEGNFDETVLNDSGEYVCVIIGIDKFKTVMGSEFDGAYAGLISMIKGMPKVSFVILDTCDNLKKNEFAQWYKETLTGTKGIWLGEGITSQYSLKSTLSSRVLNVKLDKGFGYYIDGNTTVMVKFITESGEEEYETL